MVIALTLKLPNQKGRLKFIVAIRALAGSRNVPPIQFSQ